MTSPFYYFALHPKQLGDFLDLSSQVLGPFPERSAMQRSRSAAGRGREGSLVGHILIR